MKLVEYIKTLPKESPEDFITYAVLKKYAESCPVLGVLDFEDIPGNSYTYDQKVKRPGVGFRGINEQYKQSYGVINPITEVLKIMGGEVTVDNYHIKTGGKKRLVSETLEQVEEMAYTFTKSFIKGDSTSNPREIDGLQVRVTGEQLIKAGSDAGGSPLSLTKLDELCDAIAGQDAYLLMSKAMRRKLSAASRRTDIGGFLESDKDAFGRTLRVYNDLPILIVDKDESGNKILGFNEVSPNGGAAQCTSIYAVSFGKKRLQGIQSGAPEVNYKGEMESKPAHMTRIEWFPGITVNKNDCIARLAGITDEAVVA